MWLYVLVWHELEVKSSSALSSTRCYDGLKKQCLQRSIVGGGLWTIYASGLKAFTS